eukprot:m.1637300 g.1637300  ORF g.1637300 m.1637300 type:complete len:74 (-) comp25677_c0_seq1:315-536(-)
MTIERATARASIFRLRGCNYSFLDFPELLEGALTQAIADAMVKMTKATIKYGIVANISVGGCDDARQCFPCDV